MAESSENRRSHFAMIPNMIDDLSLSVYAVRLYLRIKRRAGEDGRCWENTANLAAGCSMSDGSVTKAKKELATAGLISIHKEKNKNGGKDNDIITIVDIWNENAAFYSSSSKELSSSPHELANSPHELISSPGEIKNAPVRKTNEEKRVEELPTSLSNLAPQEEREVCESSTRAIHPAVSLIKRVTGILLDEDFDWYAITRLGDNPDVDQFVNAYQAWVLEGNKKTNLRGILDWYENGIPERKAPESREEKQAKNKVDKDPNFTNDQPGDEHEKWCPAELVRYFRLLFGLARIYPYTPREKRKWIKELQIFNAENITPESLKDGIEHLQNQPDIMTIASPKSVFAVAMSCQIRNDELDERNREYLKNKEEYG